MANTLDKSRANQKSFDGHTQKIQTRASYSEASGTKACSSASMSNAINRPALKKGTVRG